MFYHVSFFAACLIVLALLFRYRPQLFARLPLPDRLRQYSGYTPLSTFEQQRDAGLSSSNFDLEANIAGDSRTGLDDQATQEILTIMRRNGVTFDEARLIRQTEVLARNGIDPSGMPLDSKAITRL